MWTVSSYLSFSETGCDLSLVGVKGVFLPGRRLIFLWRSSDKYVCYIDIFCNFSLAIRELWIFSTHRNDYRSLNIWVHWYINQMVAARILYPKFLLSIMRNFHGLEIFYHFLAIMLWYANKTWIVMETFGCSSGLEISPKDTLIFQSLKSFVEEAKLLLMHHVFEKL